MKLRGFRIELGEIEALLRAHSAVRENVVIVSDNRLVAYVTPEDDGLTGNELRSYLKERLPQYMVPSVFMMLDEMPLTASGKVGSPPVVARMHRGRSWKQVMSRHARCWKSRSLGSGPMY